jgi:hypothetical protein
VGRLRKKLDANLIQTVRGLGYTLDAPPDFEKEIEKSAEK